jgi:NADPH:quinone reductase-like Zn-dependent oxidoreductase
MNTLEFQVRKTDLHQTRWQATPMAELPEGAVRVHVDSFALTSNNITYAAFGKTMSYWEFYPVDDAWGSIPVWGFATVVQSRSAEIPEGERFYGYYPMASHAVLQPTRVSGAGFVEGSLHRANLHAVYNQYTRCATDPLYTAKTEGVQALLRPLFFTSWLVDDFLEDQDFFGIRQPGQAGLVLLSSASSKTAYGTAFQLAHRKGIEVVGLTSNANRAFCESLGCYHRVLSYDQFTGLAPDTPAVYVDFAGNASLRQQVHRHFVKLAYSSSIGGTHVEHLGGASGLPGPRPTLFFAPAQIKKRHADWGAKVLGERLASAWHEFTAQVTRPDLPWMVVEQGQGREAVEKAYQQLLGGGGDPRWGRILSLG